MLLKLEIVADSVVMLLVSYRFITNPQQFENGKVTDIPIRNLFETETFFLWILL